MLYGLSSASRVQTGVRFMFWPRMVETHMSGSKATTETSTARITSPYGFKKNKFRQVPLWLDNRIFATCYVA